MSTGRFAPSSVVDNHPFQTRKRTSAMNCSRDDMGHLAAFSVSAGFEAGVHNGGSGNEAALPVGCDDLFVNGNIAAAMGNQLGTGDRRKNGA